MPPSTSARAASARAPGAIPQSRPLPAALVATARGCLAAILVLVTVAGTLALVALPYAWLLLLAALTDMLSLPALVALAALLVGIPASMIAGVRFLLQVNDAYEHLRGHDGPTGRVAPVWRRGLTDTRQPRRLRMLDIVLVTTVGAALAALCIWIVAFSGSSIRL